MKTSYFTFGQSHVHKVNGKVFDKDCVVKITDDDPRDVMFKIFGRSWAFQHHYLPDMKYYPRGVIEL